MWREPEGRVALRNRVSHVAPNGLNSLCIQEVVILNMILNVPASQVDKVDLTVNFARCSVIKSCLQKHTSLSAYITHTCEFKLLSIIQSVRQPTFVGVSSSTVYNVHATVIHITNDIHQSRFDLKY